eukprot:CAMPEP_0197522276 /NCGR_PEP_ID=MMETSP1318-20131121/7455_1 /TAXON_ID=552666 /ORGANISM="Partenskyella glossopodia, Strain RCC365" /LENGTH=124 /DNA_ID=CAMNT_0043074603 /DNA_START=128 /DNA_END=502 /DNA_ORIENTATION=+
MAAVSSAEVQRDDPPKPEPYPKLGNPDEYFSWTDNVEFMGDPFHSTRPAGGDYPPRLAFKGQKYSKHLNPTHRMHNWFDGMLPKTDYNTIPEGQRQPLPGKDLMVDQAFWRQPQMAPASKKDKK